MNRPWAILLTPLLLTVCIPCLAFGQSREQGEALFQEALSLQESARTKQDFENAAQRFLEAARAFEVARFDNGIAEANLSLGRIYVNRLKMFSKAGECFEKSLEAFTNTGDVKGQAWALNGLGVVSWRMARYDKATEYYEKALQMFKEVGDPRGEARATDNVAIIYEMQGHRDRAVEYSRKSVEIFRRLGDRSGESRALINLGATYKNLGRYAKAAACYESALQINKDLGDRRGEGNTLLGLAIVYGNWIDHSKSAEYADKALSLFREINDQGREATAMISLGMTYRDWGRYSTAVEYLKKALSLTRGIGDRRNESVTLAALGLAHAHLDEFSEALVNYRDALTVCKEIGLPTDFTLNRIANLYLTMGQIDKAEPFVMEAGYTATLGRFHLLRGEYEKAKGFYEKLSASRHSDKERSEDNRYAAYTGLGLAYEGMGNYSEAAEYYLKAVKHTEDLRSTVPQTQRHNFFQVRIEGFFRTEPYEGLSRVLMRMNRPLEAFKGSEYTKARVFAEALSRPSNSGAFDIPPDVLRRDSELNDRLAAMKKSFQVAYENESQQDIAELGPQVRGVEEALQAHIQSLRKRHPMFANTKYPEPIDLEQTALRDGEWLLTYDLTDSGLLVYLTRGKELKKALFKPVHRRDVDELVRRFREPLDIKSSERLTRERLTAFDFGAGKKLSALLLGGILDHLPSGAPVTIVPDDSLGLLPFEVLVLNEHGTVRTDGKIPHVVGCEFFGDRNPISYYQSVTALTLARTYGKPAAKGKKLLVIADPVLLMTDSRVRKKDPEDRKPDHGLSALYASLLGGAAGEELSRRATLTGDLAQNLKQLYGADAEVLTGLDANKETFLAEIGPRLSDYRNVLLATHGYFGKDLPGVLEPVLVLTLVPPGTDGYLRMSEVIGLRMNSDLVALTACQTGVGNRVSGEGVLGMGRAFQYAGARAVLMSLWAVSERASVMLMESFFRNLKEGKGKLEALTLARSEIRGAGFDHPFYWAPFVLVGETR